MDKSAEENKIAVVGGGCFWCTEAVFKMVKGVVSVEPGYAGGTVENPAYEQVSAGNTGHAEVIKIEYDPQTISFRDLLTVFFGSHDPTSKNRQGNDIGAEYKSVIFYTSPEEKEWAEKVIKELNESNKAGAPVVTELEPLEKFYSAGDYHKDYFIKHPSQPYCQLVINPKLEKVRKEFVSLLKDSEKGA